MIIILVNTQVEKENVNFFEEKLELIANSAKELDGCKVYDWYRNPKEENSYMVYGEFHSMDHFENYKKSYVVKMIVEQLIPLTSRKPKFKHFQGEIFEQG